MASVQDRLKLKRESCDTWSTREQLCLASSVSKSGDQNWISVSRSLRPFAEKEALRPPDWFSQKSCAIQYALLLENADTPKRKKRESGETVGESIVKRLTQERITELGQILAFQRDEYQQLKTEVNLLKSGNISDDKLHKMWQQIEQEEKETEQKAKAHAAWLAQRQRKNESPTPQLSISTPRKSIELSSENQELQELQPETEEDKKNRGGRSPLLTSLLKSPSPTTQIQNPPSTGQTTSPTIASLLGATAKTPSPQISTTASAQLHHLVTSTLAPSAAERPSVGAPTLSMLLELPSKLSRGSLTNLQTNNPQAQLVDSSRTKISNNVTSEITTGGIPVTETMIIDSIDDVIGNKDKLPETMDKDEINEIIGDIEELIKEEITKSPKPIDSAVSLMDIPVAIVEPKILKNVDEIISGNSPRSEMAMEEIDQSTTNIAEIIGTAIEPEPKVIVQTIPEATPVAVDVEKKPSEEIKSTFIEEQKVEIKEEKDINVEEMEVIDPEQEETIAEQKEVLPKEITNVIEAEVTVSESQATATQENTELKKEDETVDGAEKEVEKKEEKSDEEKEEVDKKEIKIEPEDQSTVDMENTMEFVPDEQPTESKSPEVNEDKPLPKRESPIEKPDEVIEKLEEPEETPAEQQKPCKNDEMECEPTEVPAQENEADSETIEEKPMETAIVEVSEEVENEMEIKNIEKESEEVVETPEESTASSEISKSPKASEDKGEELKEEKTIKSAQSSPKPDTEEELEPPVLPNELEDVSINVKTEEKEAGVELEEKIKELEPEPQNDTKELIKEDPMDCQSEEQQIESKTEDKEPKLEKEEIKKEEEVKKEETSTPASAADDTDIDEEESSLTKLPAGRAMKTYSKKQNAVVDSETETETSETTDYKIWKKSILLHYSRLATHKFASLFLRPITEDQAPGYHSVVFRPMDLSTIKKNIDNGTIRTNMQFQRDVMLMFQNAIMYNQSDSVIYKMAVSMQEECLQSMQILVEATGEGAFRRETRTTASSSSETSEGSSFIKRKRSHITPSPLDTDSPRMKKRRKSEND